jgi:hypothetical protein
MITAQNTLVRKPQGKIPFVKLKKRDEDNIKIDREIRRERVNWTELAQDRVQCRNSVNAVKTFGWSIFTFGVGLHKIRSCKNYEYNTTFEIFTVAEITSTTKMEAADSSETLVNTANITRCISVYCIIINTIHCCKQMVI